ncbi:MAG: family membership [Vicinamibacterales bacterium]
MQNHRRIVQGVATLVTLGAAGVAVLLAALAVERRTEITLPIPTGAFAVGRTIFDWTDEATADTLAPVAGARRELLVWIWYPSAAGTTAPIADYIPAAMRAAVPASGPMKWVTRDASQVHAHSRTDPGLSPQPPTFPVVVMRAGASAGVANYTTLAEDLASHGYVVVGFDAPYRTSAVVFPDGRVMRRTPANNPERCAEKPQAEQDACMTKLLAAWTADTAFVLDRLEGLNTADASGTFTGRLDLTRVGMFGHSFGGATTAQFCHDDARCKAGIDVDGQPFGDVVQSGLRQPFMFLLSDHAAATDPVSRQILANIGSIYDRLPADGRRRLAIRGANHFLFSDDGGLLKSHVVLGALRRLGVVGIDGRRQLEITAYCVRSFFDAHLKGSGAEGWTIASPLYPEIQVLE